MSAAQALRAQIQRHRRGLGGWPLKATTKTSASRPASNTFFKLLFAGDVDYQSAGMWRECDRVTVIWVGFHVSYWGCGDRMYPSVWLHNLKMKQKLEIFRCLCSKPRFFWYDCPPPTETAIGCNQRSRGDMNFPGASRKPRHTGAFLDRHCL